MNLSSLNLFFAETATPATQQDPKTQSIITIGWFVIMGVMFYLILIRPQQKRAKEQAALLKTIKKGDKIVTSSGIVGVVLTVKDNTVVIRSEETKLEIIKSTVSAITESSGEVSQA
jgi:preprotein translocase subunit YajC